MKPLRGQRVVLSFRLGNPGQLATMLWNMRNRAVVDGFIACTIDGEPQPWWDKQQEDTQRQHEEWERRYAIEKAEHARLDALIDAELQRDPTRTDEEISALVPGTRPPWVGQGRDRMRLAAVEIIVAELKRDPARPDSDIVASIPWCDPAWCEQARERLRWYRMWDARQKDNHHASRARPRLVGGLSR